MTRVLFTGECSSAIVSKLVKAVNDAGVEAVLIVGSHRGPVGLDLLPHQSAAIRTVPIMAPLRSTGVRGDRPYLQKKKGRS